jgi:hypothetical protein
MDGLRKARERVSAFHEVSHFGGAPMSGECARVVVAKDFLHSRLGNDNSVDVPDAASFEGSGGEKRSILVEVLGQSDRV